jgi:hypothetical protein
MVGQRDHCRGAHSCPEIEQVSAAMPGRRPEQHRIEAGAKPLGGLCDGQTAAQKGVVCDVRTFYNFSAVG